MGVAYNRCLQITFILFQIAFLAFGGVMVGLGVWLEFEERVYEDIINNEDELLIGPYLIVAAGCAIIVVSVIGIFGAVYDHVVNRFLLYLYIILVIIIFAAQAAGGILGFVYREEVLEEVREGLNNTIDDYGGDSSTARSITDAWDEVQENLECCGINNISDWIALDLPNLGNASFPASCCEGSASEDPPNPCRIEDTFSDGCEDALTEFLEDNLLIVASIGISFIVAEVIVVLMAFCLVCCTDFD